MAISSKLFGACEINKLYKFIVGRFMLQMLVTVNSKSSEDLNAINTDTAMNDFHDLIQNYKEMCCDNSRNKNIINTPSTSNMSNVH